MLKKYQTSNSKKCSKNKIPIKFKVLKQSKKDSDYEKRRHEK